MTTEIFLQSAILILTLALLYSLYRFPKQALTNKLRPKSRHSAQSHQHFLTGAHLLTRARSTSNKTTAHSLAKSAVAEADKALALKPKDAATLILKGLALGLMGHNSPALKCLDAALSPAAARGLSERERADALVARAELRMAVNRRRRGRVESVIADLVEAVGVVVGPANGRAFCLLGECYVIKGMRDEAREAFSRALEIDSGLQKAQLGLAVLGE